MSMAMIHLSVPIKDIASTVRFYRDILGCSITRQQVDRLDIDFYGHHLVAQLSELEASHKSITIGRGDYPLRHFGVIVTPEIYDRMLANLIAAQVEFAMAPDRIFIGTPREQSVFLVFDYSGNAVEVKGMPDPQQVFAAG
ncbi:MAG: VOC family protein [Burkholderiaceae bacterium]|nr:VOC family protein [Burkholderiaceae bacterium]